MQDQPGLQVLRRAINRGQVFAVLEWPASFESLQEVLRKAVFESEVIENNLRLLRESSRQNRELEKLNESLEKIVAERTHHIQISKELQEDKIARVRGLTRFVQELSTRSSFEDILKLLRRDMRSFHDVHEPLFLYELDASGPYLISFRAGRSFIKKWPYSMELVQNIHLSDPDLSKKLANVLGRPFSKAMVIPIEMPLHEDSLAMPGFHLIIENSIPDSDISEVLDFCLERLEPLTTAIERIRVEQELIHFSYRWEKTFDGLKDPIAIIDRRDQVLRSNRKFATRGRKSECYEMFAGQTSRCEGCPVLQVLETGEVSKGEVRREGRVYEVYSYPIALVPGGRPTNVVNQYVDQTESRELYMRLLQSEKMGALGLLAGNIAHELNNPLTGIRSLAQVIKEGLDPRSQLAADLTEIEKASERSQKIIRNLLEFVEQKDPVLSDVTVDDLVEKTLPFLKTAFRMLRVKKDLQTANVIVRAEPQMLQQVFFNLIHNACQAMGKAGTLSLETEVNQDQLIFWVRDTGPGIAPDMQQKIFEPFFTTKKEGSGTGLGLSLSKEIIERFGGKIGLTSVVGEGTSFWVSFPIVRIET